ncbi:MAG: aldo/keto reductase [Gammaproteobacteria bacterium]|jgi:diketogulonate reductase-like aldo/keto reductase
MKLSRRRFLHNLAALGTLLMVNNGQASPSRHTRIIPSSSEQIPVIGMGSWLVFAIDPENEQELESRSAVIEEFLKLGGGMIDSSPMYGVAEDVIGRSLKRIDDHSGLFAATKVWTHGNRQGLLQMENSRLLWGLPRFDLMQVHNLMDWQTHLPNLYDMRDEGQIRYVGVTTSHGRRHDELIDVMRTEPIDFVQFTYNLLDREAENYLLPLAADRGIAVIINRPFQRGGLFDRFARYKLPKWAGDIDCANWAQYFLKFIVSHPAVTCAIPATSRVDHLQQNMGAARGRLPDQAMRRQMVNYVESL